MSDQTTGLTTNTLHDGVVNKGVIETTKLKPEDTVFDIAKDIDLKAAQLLDVLEKNNQEMEIRFQNISQSINKIKNEI